MARVTGQYTRVLMLGDSMGATGALMFSPLATSVHAFAPQACPCLVYATAPDIFLPLRFYHAQNHKDIVNPVMYPTLQWRQQSSYFLGNCRGTGVGLPLQNGLPL